MGIILQNTMNTTATNILEWQSEMFHRIQLKCPKKQTKFKILMIFNSTDNSTDILVS